MISSSPKMTGYNFNVEKMITLSETMLILVINQSLLLSTSYKTP